MQNEPSKIIRIGGREVCIAGGSERFDETVVLFGGTPNSRLFGPPQALLDELEVRLVTFDRPGYGQSGRASSASWADSAAMTTAVLEELEIETCRFVGWSAGAGHAWHGAAAMGGDCQGLTVVSGLCSISDDRLFTALPADSAARLKLLRKAPLRLRQRMLRWALTPTAERAKKNPSDRVNETIDHASDEDAEILTRQANMTMLEADVDAAFSQGVSGWLADALLMTQRWSAEVTYDLPLRVIHAEADGEVGIDSGDAIADLAGVELEVTEGGHYWILDNWAQILGLW